MKKIFLGIITVLTLTLFVGCTKETEIKPDEEITNPIGTIKCINTLDELMSDDYEPKFEINNDEYIDGEFPYINMDFAEADEINKLMKAYALTNTSYLLADSENLKNNNEEGYYTVTVTPQVKFIDDKYVFIIIKTKDYTTTTKNIYAIDIENNKILTKQDILDIAGYDLDSNIDALAEKIVSDPNYETKNENYKILSKEDIVELIKKDLENNDINFACKKFDSKFNLSDYGKIKFENSTYDSNSLIFAYLNNPYTYYYINENNKLILVLNTETACFVTPVEYELN